MTCYLLSLSISEDILPNLESGNGGAANQRHIKFNQGIRKWRWRKWRCSEPAAAANQRRQRPSGGSDPAAATTQRRQRPSGDNDPAARKWRCSEPVAAVNQRRQRPSDGNDPAAATNQRTSDGGGVGYREREERNGDCGGEGEKEKKGWLG
ncbi:hypothetical protein DEO72_LG3g1071 [Vigna unguiculata]|uniref:Uncharacterized protein n=1 Tax=Vigna unguiculata TaxID=3917 RepID=A0A4D6LDF5_VIGUN|nr:hypothetical protein DEO72_LG3g1071 [Vigna unguiculata]